MCLFELAWFVDKAEGLVGMWHRIDFFIFSFLKLCAVVRSYCAVCFSLDKPFRVGNSRHHRSCCIEGIA